MRRRSVYLFRPMLHLHLPIISQCKAKSLYLTLSVRLWRRGMSDTMIISINQEFLKWPK